MQTAQDTPLIEAKGLCQTIQNNRCILDNVNFKITLGTTSAIIGRSGCGKSTLLRALIGLEPVDKGEVLWKGLRPTPLEIPKIRREVIYLHQTPAFIEGTVEENLIAPFQFASKTAAFHRPTIIEYLKALQLGEEFMLSQASDLSGGEAQIVAILRAIQLEPKVLLLDEPTAALDNTTKGTVESLIDSWFEADKENRSYILVTHDGSHTKCQHTYSMEDGQLKLEDKQ